MSQDDDKIIDLRRPDRVPPAELANNTKAILAQMEMVADGVKSGEIQTVGMLYGNATTFSFFTSGIHTQGLFCIAAEMSRQLMNIMFQAGKK